MNTSPTGHAGLPARLKRWVTAETTGGVLLMVAALVAIVWANSPWRESYTALSEFTIGPSAIHLDLSLATWAADGLLAVFFFVVGVELKHEIVAGSLRHPKQAAVPVVAAVGGMILPAILYTSVILLADDSSALHGWAIPSATDIAFALAVLAIFGRGLPKALRTFLLTLAVVDDLLAIIIIAIFYTGTINIWSLLAAFALVAVFAFVVRTKNPRWWLLVPIAVAAWVFMHESGVHATIAGVMLGLSVPALAMHGEKESRVHRYDESVRPFSSGFALPVFAFFSAGVTLVGGEGIGAALGQPVVFAIIAGLVLGKFLGVLGVTALVTKLTPLRLPDAIGVRDLLPVAFLTGIGFTVSLLISELSFADGEHTAGAKAGILLGTLIAATLAAFSLRWDARKLRSNDMNEDGIPDIDTELIKSARDVEPPVAEADGRPESGR